MKLCAMLLVAVVLGMLVSRIPMAHGQAQAAAGQPAAAPNSPPGLDAEIDRFWKTWEAGQPSDAIRRFAPNAGAAWDRVYRAADEYHSRLGSRCLGHTEIERRPMGDRVMYMTFFANYRTQPIRVELMYYRARERWHGIACHVDENPSVWLQEMAQNADYQQGAPVQVQVQPIPITPDDEQ